MSNPNNMRPDGDLQEFNAEKKVANYKWQTYGLIFVAILAFILAVGFFVQRKASEVFVKPQAQAKEQQAAAGGRKFDQRPPVITDEPPALPEGLVSPSVPAPIDTVKPSPAHVPSPSAGQPAPIQTVGNPPQPERKGSMLVPPVGGSDEPAIAVPQVTQVTPLQTSIPSSAGLKSVSFGAGAQTALGASLDGTQIKTSRATKAQDRNLALLAGSFIPCVLHTELISSVAGFTSCIVMDNVYSDDGSTLVIDKGAQVIGEFRNAVRTGDARLFVLWNRIKTKNGVLVELGSPGGDQVGGMGLPGYVDNHWWERIGAAFLLSSFQDVMAIERAKSQGGSNGGTVVNTAPSNTADSAQSFAKEVLKTTIGIPPTIYKNRGEEIMIYVARDISFSDVYKVAEAGRKK